MSDLITVTMDALQTEFDNEVVRAVQNVGIYVDKEKLIEALQLAESLVRCKDCKHTITRPDGEIYCEKLDMEEIPVSHFCGWGERKGGEKE